MAAARWASCAARWYRSRRSGTGRSVFFEQGVDGLLRDATRPAGKVPVPASKIREALELTQSPPPGEATHWTVRAMAKRVGLAWSTVRVIWRRHGLAPHRIRTFKLSKDPAFAEKLHDVVRLYVNSPEHAVVLSIDEKSQIQALGRTQDLLPMKAGQPETRTHDYTRHGTTTLFAVVNILDGTVIGQHSRRHRQEEFISFLDHIRLRSSPTSGITSSWTTTQRTRPLECSNGSPTIRTGSFTSRQPPRPG